MADPYANYTRSELIDELRLKEKLLLEWKVKDDPTDGQKKTTQAEIVTELREAVRVLKEKVNTTALVPAENKSGDTPTQNTVVSQYTRTTKQTLIAQYVTSVGQLVVPKIERWTSEMDRIHTLEVHDDDEFETDFVKMVKQQLPPNIFTYLYICRARIL